MLPNFKESQLLYHLRLRVPKDAAYFVYFTLESNEGLCSFSTNDDSLHGSFRDIDLFTSIELRESVLNLIHRLQEEYRIDILTEKITQDS